MRRNLRKRSANEIWSWVPSGGTLPVHLPLNRASDPGCLRWWRLCRLCFLFGVCHWEEKTCVRGVCNLCSTQVPLAVSFCAAWAGQHLRGLLTEPCRDCHESWMQSSGWVKGSKGRCLSGFTKSPASISSSRKWARFWISGSKAFITALGCSSGLVEELQL